MAPPPFPAIEGYVDDVLVDHHGAGWVFSARDARTGERVYLKRYNRRDLGMPESDDVYVVDSFQCMDTEWGSPGRSLVFQAPDVAREAFRANGVHDALVPTHAAGVDSMGGPWTASPPVAGETLRDWIRRHGRRVGPRLRAVVQPVFSALGALHAQGQFHGSLTDRKVLVTNGAATDVVRVTDAGAWYVRARSQDDYLMWMDRTLVASSARETHVAKASPPDILRAGRDPSETSPLDSRSDVWSLGVLALQVSIGRDPTPEDVTTSPLEPWLRGCLAPWRTDRFRDAKEAWGALEPML